MAKDDLEEKTIAELFQQDAWINQFMHEVYDSFGLPTSTQNCLNKSDKILFIFGMMSLVRAMKTHELWKELRSNGVNAKEAAYDYIKSYYDSTGNMLIDSTGGADY